MIEPKYHSTYKPGATTHIAVHHTGGTEEIPTASSQDLTAEQVSKFHRNKWNFISSLGWYGGYNFFIEKDGKITQFRAIGEETAAQIGYNFNGKVISICIAGNFSVKPDGTSVNYPKGQQIQALKDLVAVLPHVPPDHIRPHRFFQPTTQCFGSLLKDTWAEEQIYPPTPPAPAPKPSPEELQKQIALLSYIADLWRQILALRQKLNLGGFFRRKLVDCNDDLNVRG